MPAVDPTEAARYEAFRANGRATLLAGDNTYDRPLGETGRWGVSAVFRPSRDVLDQLAELNAELHDVIGDGHWIHGPGCLHSTLRALELYRADISPGDPGIQAYADALDEAAAGIPPVEFDISGVSPHQGGLLLLLSPSDKTLVTLQERYDDALHAREACRFDGEHRRDLWNIGLVHFASRLTDPERFVAWCDQRRDLGLSTITFDAVDLVRAHQEPSDIRLETLHRAALLGHPHAGE
ncbi:2'-5' RNA ligase family protein [Flindersiella endophytica]